MAQQVGKSNADHLASQGSIFFHIRGWLKTSPMLEKGIWGEIRIFWRYIQILWIRVGANDAVLK